jgi:outer membrane protein OmpA-like peptidoglycan-associated protein
MKRNYSCSFLIAAIALSAAALSGCSVWNRVVKGEPQAVSPPVAPPTFEGRGIGAAERAVATRITTAKQPAHYEPVFVDTHDEQSASLQTISLQDAVAHDVLASSELLVNTLDHLDTKGLEWLVLGRGDARPNELEALAGAGARSSAFAEVRFAPKEADILNVTQLDALLKLSSRVGGVFYLVGYGDERGKSSDVLALERANAVANALKAGGVNPSRIQVFAGGVSDTYREPERNRRVTIAFHVQ